MTLQAFSMINLVNNYLLNDFVFMGYYPRQGALNGLFSLR